MFMLALGECGWIVMCLYRKQSLSTWSWLRCIHVWLWWVTGNCL